MEGFLSGATEDEQGARVPARNLSLLARRARSLWRWATCFRRHQATIREQHQEWCSRARRAGKGEQESSEWSDGVKGVVISLAYQSAMGLEVDVTVVHNHLHEQRTAPSHIL
jgi:hypothetical protein